jgi:hypothetical protein
MFVKALLEFVIDYYRMINTTDVIQWISGPLPTSRANSTKLRKTILLWNRSFFELLSIVMMLKESFVLCSSAPKSTFTPIIRILPSITLTLNASADGDVTLKNRVLVLNFL